MTTRIDAPIGAGTSVKIPVSPNLRPGLTVDVPLRRPDPTDPMGTTAAELLQWMLKVAEARDSDPKARTVNLKFSAATLRMWRDRAQTALSPRKVRTRSGRIGTEVARGQDEHGNYTEVLFADGVTERFPSEALWPVSEPPR